MAFDPFARGSHPVGVRSDEVSDNTRDGRKLGLEIWYPAAAVHTGQDLAKETQDRFAIFGGHQVRQDAVRDAVGAPGVFPLILFSHGFAGHRRQSTFFCTHLASHGYVVVALDHGGNTLNDMLALALRIGAGELLADVQSLLGSYVFDRPRDLRYVLDAVAAGAVPALVGVDVSAVGVSGHSFGGWTTLVTAARDQRVRAALALAPAGAAGPLSSSALAEQLTLDFDGRVDTLYLALERDSLLPLAGIEALYRRTPPPARMFVLGNSDHMHFCDRAERSHEFFRSMPQIGPLRDIAKNLPPIEELVPGAHGYAFANAMGVAHMDAALKHSADARAFLELDPVLVFRERGIVITETRAQSWR